MLCLLWTPERSYVNICTEQAGWEQSLVMALAVGRRASVGWG